MAQRDNDQEDFSSAIRAAKAKKPQVEIPKMPRLDQAPPDPRLGAQSYKAAQKVLTPEQQRMLEERGTMASGVGSAYAANQPGLSQLPVDDNGNEKPIDPRLIPRSEGAGLRPETIKDLERLAEANKAPEDKELDQINKDINDIEDVYETNEFGERVRSLLQNKKRKTAVENRCSPMAFEDLLMNGFVTQRVPIIPGQFEPTFRSLNGDEDIEIKRLMGSIRGPDQYVLDTFSLFNLAAGLYAINGKVLINHLDNDGNFDEKKFKEKYKVISKMAIPILADLSVNFSWFTRRVQKLTVVDDIKGF